MSTERTRLLTWGERSIFEYSGSVFTGTKLHFGTDFRWEVMVTRDIYSQMLREFAGREVPAGTSKSDPPDGSLGDWLMKNLTRQALASYVAAILVHEKYAQKARHMINFR
jgi:hypothetical protein